MVASSSFRERDPIGVATTSTEAAMTDLYDRVSMRLDRQDERIKERFARADERLKDLERRVTHNDTLARTHLNNSLDFLQARIDNRFKDVRRLLDDIVASQRQMQKTVDLIRAAVILGPDAVRHAMAWDGPPPFITPAAATAASPDSIADSATSSAGDR
jgi:uncharacterized coiled-coil protein SlyX